MIPVRFARSVAVLAGTLFTLVILSACQPIQPMAAAPAAAAPAASEQTAATGTMTETEAMTETTESSGTNAAEAAGLMMASNDTLGDFVVDSAGMTLYVFDKDTQGSATAEAVSNCYDKCADAWPPLLTEEEAKTSVGDGLDASLVGTTERKDGTYQVTYNGWPLYYWYEDAAPGDTLGQTVGNVWWVATPAGEAVRGIIKIGKTDALGEFVVDMKGMTLYQFDKDTQGAAGAEAVSNCYDKCAEAWPPFVIDEGTPVLPGAKIDGALLGTIERTDGTYQVTLNGWPLYYFAQDKAEGDTTGQASHDVWWVVSPAGEPMH